MTKKEKLEYFKLVEPKLREKYIENDGQLENAEFERLNIRGKDISLFKEKYESYWEDERWQSLFDDDNDNTFFDLLEGFEDVLTSEDFGTFYTGDFPEDKLFFQLGITNLDVKGLKLQLQLCKRFIYINKFTGTVSTKDKFELQSDSNQNDVQNQLRLIINSPETFLYQLTNGEIDKILENQKKNPSMWKIPALHPMSKALEILDVDNLIEVLYDDRKWLLYMDWAPKQLERFSLKKFRSFEGFQEIKEFELELINSIEPFDIPDFVENRFFFKVVNPKKMKARLLDGDMNVLDEIKNITFSSSFLPNKNEA